jgi:hypothetical protein
MNDYRKANLVFALLVMGIAGIVLVCLFFADEAHQCTVEEPVWTEAKAIRQVEGLGDVLGDIESHMPKGHIYSEADRVGWAHETTHGLHARLRNLHNQPGTNSFYVLEDRAIIIKEPDTTIRRVAAAVPKSLRGMIYNDYMLQAWGWNEIPLYIFDEWVAYGNGAAVRHDLKIQGRSETVRFALEMNVYAMTLMYVVNPKDKHLKNFFMWNTERTMDLYWKNGPTQQQRIYLEKLRTSPDAEKLRAFMRKYYSPEWTARVLGF